MWIDLSLNLKFFILKFILLQWGQGFCEIDVFYFLFVVVLGDFCGDKESERLLVILNYLILLCIFIDYLGEVGYLLIV